ncbi:unnamed protein product [Sphagnum compactum]
MYELRRNLLPDSCKIFKALLHCTTDLKRQLDCGRFETVAAAPCLATGENALHQQQLVKWPHQSSRKMTILRIADSSSTLHSP